jgi:hypothetical protein
MRTITAGFVVRHLIAMLVVLALIPVTALAQEEAQEEAEEAKGLKVTGIPIIDYNRSTDLKLGALGIEGLPVMRAISRVKNHTVGRDGNNMRCEEPSLEPC